MLTHISPRAPFVKRNFTCALSSDLRRGTTQDSCWHRSELSTVVPGRKSDDNAHVKLRFTNGARGLMWVSMAATGNLHGQRIRVFGEKASLEWIQEQPEQLHLRP